MPINDSKAGAGKKETARAIVSPSVAAQIKAAAMTEGVAHEPGIATAGQLPPAGPKFAARPGVERWPVKTGTDADVAKVGKNAINGKLLAEGIVPTTVEELIRIPRPADMMPPTSELPAFEEKRKEPV